MRFIVRAIEGLRAVKVSARYESTEHYKFQVVRPSGFVVLNHLLKEPLT
jgi:hypothetical protein